MTILAYISIFDGIKASGFNGLIALQSTFFYRVELFFNNSNSRLLCRDLSTHTPMYHTNANSVINILYNLFESNCRPVILQQRHQTSSQCRYKISSQVQTPIKFLLKTLLSPVQTVKGPQENVSPNF